LAVDLTAGFLGYTVLYGRMGWSNFVRRCKCKHNDFASIWIGQGEG
jgi:hypothetical protein